MHLSMSQKNWIQRFIFNRLGTKPFRGMYVEPYRRYLELGGTRARWDFTNFLSRNVGSRKVVDSLPEGEAEIALQSIGLSLSKLSAIDVVMRDMMMRDMKVESASAISNAEEQFLQACAALLWTKNGNDLESNDVDLQEPLLQLLDSIIEHTEIFTYGQKKLIFHELFDFLLENRQYERWEHWVESIAREYRKYFCAHVQKGYSDWFPGYIVRDGGSVEAKTKVVDSLTREEFDEMAFLVCCKDMEVNNVRHIVFSHTIQIERLTSKVAKLKRDPNADPVEIANAEYDLKEHKTAKQRGKRLLRKAFGEIKRYIKPVWEAVGKSQNPNRWYFLFQCARLFYDFARYHYYSSLKEDRDEAIGVYEQIVSMAHTAAKDEHVDVVLRCRFNYLSATACRYKAEYTSNQYQAISFIVTALEDSCSSVEQINDANKCEHLSLQTRKALNYRFTRHYGRTKTFAIRWWLKHGCPVALFCNPAVDDNPTENEGAETESELVNAERCYYNSICQPLGIDEGRPGDIITLKGKRKLEWEFHLRVTIEMLVQDVHRFVQDTHVNKMVERADLYDPLIDAEKALCLIISIYCYLFSARKDELEAHRPFTHISREIESRAIKWLVACNEEPEALQFDYTHLRGIRQSEPPSPTSQLETICAIMFDFSNREILSTQLYQILDERLCKPEIQDEHAEFRDTIWTPFKEALRNDMKNVEDIYEFEMNEFGKVTKANYKEYPLYRHRFEMVYGPGSNAHEIDRIFDMLKFKWNPIHAEVIQ